MFPDSLNAVLAVSATAAVALGATGVARKSGLLLVLAAFMVILAGGFGLTVFSLGDGF
ncbi:MAG: hypothetical protein ACK47B_17785 [Armatimonadota bacterium]